MPGLQRRPDGPVSAPSARSGLAESALPSTLREAETRRKPDICHGATPECSVFHLAQTCVRDEFFSGRRRIRLLSPSCVGRDQLRTQRKRTELGAAYGWAGPFRYVWRGVRVDTSFLQPGWSCERPANTVHQRLGPPSRALNLCVDSTTREDHLVPPRPRLLVGRGCRRFAPSPDQ